MPSLDTITGLLTHYGYFLLFPVAIFEGPIVTVIAAFLASKGYLNIFFVYLIVLAADISGDLIFYTLGRWHVSFLHRHGKIIGVTPERLAQAKEYFSVHHRKSLILSKTVHGIGVVGLVAAGALKVPYMKFFRITFAVSVLQSAMFVLIGFFLGHAYSTVGKYLNYFAATTTTIILAAAVVLIIYKLKKGDK